MPHIKHFHFCTNFLNKTILKVFKTHKNAEKNFNGKCSRIFRCTRKISQAVKTFANNFLSGDSKSFRVGVCVCVSEREGIFSFKSQKRLYFISDCKDHPLLLLLLLLLLPAFDVVVAVIVVDNLNLLAQTNFASYYFLTIHFAHVYSYLRTENTMVKHMNELIVMSPFCFFIIYVFFGF